MRILSLHTQSRGAMEREDLIGPAWAQCFPMVTSRLAYFTAVNSGGWPRDLSTTMLGTHKAQVASVAATKLPPN